MPNPLIELPDGNAAIDRFEELLYAPDKVFLLVLGGSDVHRNFAETAVPYAENWRHVVLAKEPSLLYPRLLTLPLRPGVLAVAPSWPPSIVAVSISISNHICRIVLTTNTHEIVPAFMLAETFMQP